MTPDARARGQALARPVPSRCHLPNTYSGLLFRQCPCTIAHHGTMAPVHRGTKAPWHRGTMAPWHHGTVAPWHPCTVVRSGTMYHGTMAPCTVVPWHRAPWHRDHGTRAPWYQCTVAPWHRAPWHHGTMAPVHRGTMAPWLQCIMAPWLQCTMVPGHLSTMSPGDNSVGAPRVVMRRAPQRHALRSPCTIMRDDEPTTCGAVRSPTTVGTRPRFTANGAYRSTNSMVPPIAKQLVHCVIRTQSLGPRKLQPPRSGLYRFSAF